MIESPQASTVEPEIDAQDEKFLEAAALADRGQDIPAELIGGKPEDKKVEQVEGEQEQKPDKPESEKPEKPARKRDAQGRFLKEDGSVDEDQVETPEDKKAEQQEATKPAKEPSDYEKKKAEKAQKDKERQDRSWEALNREKDQVRQTAQQLQQQHAQVQALLQQHQQQAQRPAGQRYSSQDLAEASAEFMSRSQKAYKEGNEEEGEKNHKLAVQAYEQATNIFKQEQQFHRQSQFHQFNQQQTVLLQQEIAKHDELRDGTTPLSKELVSVEQDEEIWPVLSRFVNAYPMAVKLAQLRLDAKEAPDLRKKVTDLEAEVKRLQANTEPAGGGPTQPARSKSFDQMSESEQDAFLLRQAEKADAERSYA